MNKEDLTGRRFGHLIVIGKAPSKASNGGYKWICKCDCGNETIAIGGDLKGGKRKTCGCRGVNLIGVKIGTLTVVERLGKINNKIMWRCKCSECGKIKDLPTYKINSRKIKGCICQRGTHRMTGTKFYRCWSGFKQRCDNPNNVEYPNYGGRGITYDERWKEFTNFYNDMYDSYMTHASIYGEKETTLDRIDFNGDYSKENCRWLTSVEQGNNRRVNIWIDINDEVKTLAEWCRYYDLDYNKTRRRYAAGLTTEEVFNLRDVEGYLVKRPPVSNNNKRRTSLIQLAIDSLGLKLEDSNFK